MTPELITELEANLAELDINIKALMNQRDKLATELEEEKQRIKNIEAFDALNVFAGSIVVRCKTDTLMSREIITLWKIQSVSDNVVSMIEYKYYYDDYVYSLTVNSNSITKACISCTDDIIMFTTHEQYANDLLHDMLNLKLDRTDVVKFISDRAYRKIEE